MNEPPIWRPVAARACASGLPWLLKDWPFADLAMPFHLAPEHAVLPHWTPINDHKETPDEAA